MLSEVLSISLNLNIVLLVTNTRGNLQQYLFYVRYPLYWMLFAILTVSNHYPICVKFKEKEKMCVIFQSVSCTERLTCFQRVYIPTSRQLRRQESVSRSPIFAHFSETLSGAATIRAYKQQDRFNQRSTELLDKSLSYYYASTATQRWFSFFDQI